MSGRVVVHRRGLSDQERCPPSLNRASTFSDCCGNSTRRIRISAPWTAWTSPHRQPDRLSICAQGKGRGFRRRLSCRALSASVAPALSPAMPMRVGSIRRAEHVSTPPPERGQTSPHKLPGKDIPAAEDNPGDHPAANLRRIEAGQLFMIKPTPYN